MDSYVWPVIGEYDCAYIKPALCVHSTQVCCGCWRKTLIIFVSSREVQGKERNSWLMVQQEAEKCCLHGGFELTPTRGQVHIPMSTKAADMCLHASPTVSRAASNDHHMLTFCLLPTPEHMELQTTAKKTQKTTTTNKDQGN